MSFTLSSLPLRLRDKIYIEPETGCWLWTASLVAKGYGQIRNVGKGYLAHRVIYELLCGRIPEGFDLHHRCRTSACVNPAHLELLSHSDHGGLHLRISHNNAFKTHCKRGHPFDEVHTYFYKNWRVCRTCKTLQARGKRQNSCAITKGKEG